MQFDNSIDLSLIAKVTDRKVSFITFLAKNLSIDIVMGAVSIEDGLKLTKALASNNSNDERLEELQSENEQLAHDKQAHELAVEFLKAERKALQEKVDLLEKHLERAEQRTDRFEQSLLRMTESVGHLANNRDILMSKMINQSSWYIKKLGSKDVLVLSEPIK
jgi:predicted RNase H-like nuclease (RuvC/YqgF family)